MTRVRLGIDIGGSGIKAAPVDTTKGELTADRHRIDTPEHSTPEAIAAVVEQLVRHFEWKGPIGITLPGVVKKGVMLTAANIHKSWVGVDADKLFTRHTANPVTVINDADAAGIAEMRFGAGRDRAGIVVMITLGTGIGCAIFHDGKLLPNSELGHIEVDGEDAETFASARIREEQDESWKSWGRSVDKFLDRIDAMIWPDLIIIGGGISKKAEKFFPFLNTRAELVPAALQNEAGIVGAALVVDDT